MEDKKRIQPMDTTEENIAIVDEEQFDINVQEGDNSFSNTIIIGE